MDERSDEDEYEKHCCSVTLIVVSEDLEPSIVTAALDMVPSQSWRRGDRNRFEREDGTVKILDSIAEWGGWKRFGSKEERQRSLQSQFDAWLERLRVRAEALRSLTDRGWRIELDCFAATSECLELSAAGLLELANLGLGIGLTFSSG